MATLKTEAHRSALDAVGGDQMMPRIEFAERLLVRFGLDRRHGNLLRGMTHRDNRLAAKVFQGRTARRLAS